MQSRDPMQAGLTSKLAIAPATGRRVPARNAAAHLDNGQGAPGSGSRDRLGPQSQGKILDQASDLRRDGGIRTHDPLTPRTRGLVPSQVRRGGVSFAKR